MYKNKLPPVLLVVMAIVFHLSSCSRQNNSPAPQSAHDPPPFNPDYFRSYERQYHAVKIKFKNGSFQLAENTVYKLPGRSIDLKKFPSGNLKISYLTASNDLIEEVNIDSPLEKLKEVGHTKFDTATTSIVDSVTFLIPLHSSNQTQKVKVQSHSFRLFEFQVPADTIDVIAANRQLVPDSTLFSGRQQK